MTRDEVKAIWRCSSLRHEQLMGQDNCKLRVLNSLYVVSCNGVQRLSLVRMHPPRPARAAPFLTTTLGRRKIYDDHASVYSAKHSGSDTPSIGRPNSPNLNNLVACHRKFRAVAFPRPHGLRAGTLSMLSHIEFASCGTIYGSNTG